MNVVTHTRSHFKLIFSIVVFFLLCNALNFLNASLAGVFWKLAGAVVVVLYIATITTEESKES